MNFILKSIVALVSFLVILGLLAFGCWFLSWFNPTF
jgi:hypothetical protein